MSRPKGGKNRKWTIETLNPVKLRRGNRFAALHTSKSLSEKERLGLLVEKLQIENVSIYHI